MTSSDKKSGDAGSAVGDIQAAADRLAGKWTAAEPERSAIARAAQSVDDRRKVDAALRFHKENGCYPWEVPSSEITEAQNTWLRASGIDPQGINDQVRAEMQALLRARSAEKEQG